MEGFENIQIKRTNTAIDCKDLISKLLERDVTKRISANKALEHNFFKTGIVEITGGINV